MAPMVVGLASSNIIISSALTKSVSALDTGMSIITDLAIPRRSVEICLVCNIYGKWGKAHYNVIMLFWKIKNKQ